MVRTLWCRLCSVGYASVAGDVPRICPGCDRETVWTTMAPVSDVPRFAWELTFNDRRFLKTIRIDAEIGQKAPT